jgi:hypothetical protein
VLQSLRAALRRASRRTLALALAAVLCRALLASLRGRPGVDLPSSCFDFTAPRLAWPVPRPVAGSADAAPTVVRIAIVSCADEFDRRDAFRTLVLADARSHDVVFVHRFFVGRNAGWFRWPWTPSVNARVRQEMEEHPDDMELHKVDENRYVLAKKRCASLRWVRSCLVIALRAPP